MAHAQLLGAVLLQEGREFAGVEMIGVVGDGLVFGRGDHLGRQSVVAELALRTNGFAEGAPGMLTQPMRRQIHLGESLRQHQGMIVAIVVGAGGPAGEARALLECGVAVAKKLGFRNAHLFQRGAQASARCLRPRR